MVYMIYEKVLASIQFGEYLKTFLPKLHPLLEQDIAAKTPSVILLKVVNLSERP